MGKNVLIPSSILEKTITLLQAWDIDSHDDGFTRYDYHYLLSDLIWYRQKVKVREAYNKMIGTNYDDAKEEARSLYLQEKQLMHFIAAQEPF